MELNSLKILIVDDEPANILIIRAAVESLGYVVSTSDSEAAMLLADEHQPDLILLDISMPKRSGFEICEELKQSAHLQHIPVIFITSHSDQAHERRALDLGAIDFITKPIDVELCRMRVENQLLIQRQKLQLEAYSHKLAEEKEHLKITLESIADGVIATDAKGNVTFINPSAQRLTGYSDTEANGKQITSVMDLRDTASNESMINPAMYALEVKRPVAMAYNAKLVSRHRKEYRVEDTASPILDASGNVKGAVIVFQDVSETVEMAVQMTHLANHDQLTGLPNRVLLHDRIVQTVNRGVTSNQSAALLLIDIDNFKYLNDSLGHKIGDSIILAVSERLNGLLNNASATLARVGGDEFACLLTDIGSGYSADSFAMSCLQIAREPMTIDGKLLQLSLSIGISLFPQDARNAEEMMRHADTAMFRAKATGKDKFSFFSRDLQIAMHRRVEMEIKLRKAIDNNKLVVFFQPKFDLLTNEVIGAECLVRMIDDDGSMVSPDEFIPLAEETGLIQRLGEQVLQKSCEFINRCELSGKPLKIAVNVSAQQIANNEYVDEVSRIIAQAGIDPKWVELEVTESALMADFEQTRNRLQALSALGLTLALDDFGTGYSSLSYLRQFPINVLKIDKSFIKDMDKEQQALDIVTAIVRLAKSLNLTLIAEGLETQQQLTALTQLGCKFGQGFFMSRPVSSDEFYNRFIKESVHVSQLT